MSTPLVDQFGRPAIYVSSSTPGRYFSTVDDRFRAFRPRLDYDIARLINQQKYRMLLSDTRWIADTFPLIQGAVQQKAEYVSAAGWYPEFVGEDEAWGEKVAPILRDALDVQDVRGILDWHDLWETHCRLCDIDGDSFIIFSEAESKFPQLQMLEAHRIGVRLAEQLVGPSEAYSILPDGKQVRGLYQGMRILNGIIYNASGREIAYRVLGPTPDDDRDISAQDMLHVCEPRWFSEGRPVPNLAYAILDWYDIKETRGFERIAQKVHSALTLVETNETGEAPPNTIPPVGTLPNGAITNDALPKASPTSGAPIENTLFAGLVRYVRAGSGKIEGFSCNRPAQAWFEFDKTIIAGAFYGMGWHYCMLDPSEFGRSSVYAVKDWINTTIRARHRRIKGFALNAVRRTVAKLANNGAIPSSPEWYKWDIPPPPDFEVDAGRAEDGDRKNILGGLDSETSVIRRTTGKTARQVLEERGKFLRDRVAIAKKYKVRPEELATLAQPGQPGFGGSGNAAGVPPPNSSLDGQ